MDADAKSVSKKRRMEVVENLESAAEAGMPEAHVGCDEIEADISFARLSRGVRFVKFTEFD